MHAYLVHHFLERAAQERPEAVFLIDHGEAVSYGDVEAAANRLARVLVAEGLRAGDRAALLAENSRFYVEAYYAVLKAGGIVVPLNTAARAPSLVELLERAAARWLIAGPRFEARARQAIELGAPLAVLGVRARSDAERSSAVRTLALEEAAASESPSPLDAHAIDLDPASIVYTSGSTGKPLGATLSHRSLVANTRSIVASLRLGAPDRVLSILPFYYVYGKSLLNTHAAVGGSLVIENRFLYPNVALDTLEREACTGLAGVPSTFAILLNRSTLAERRLGDLRYVTQAGGGMSPELIRRLQETLPGKEIFIMYGATEASARLAVLDSADLPRKRGSIGKAIPNVDLRILLPDGREAAPGQEGEIVARGSNLMSGYWGDEEATRRVLDENGYHSGDLARRDEEGFLFIVGRKNEIIKSGAHRISAREIEDAILELPEIHEAAVIGVGDEILGERIQAFVVLREGRSDDPEALKKQLTARLPAYKVPASIVVRSELPKNESGKIMKKSLC